MTEWTPTQKKRFLLLVGASCALVALDVAFPGKYEVVPPWKIQVVDSKGAPIPGAELHQTCTRFFGAHRVELKRSLQKPARMGRRLCRNVTQDRLGFPSGLDDWQECSTCIPATVPSRQLGPQRTVSSQTLSALEDKRRARPTERFTLASSYRVAPLTNICCRLPLRVLR